MEIVFLTKTAKAQRGKTMISPRYLVPLVLTQCEQYSQHARVCLFLNRANEMFWPYDADNIVEGV